MQSCGWLRGCPFAPLSGCGAVGEPVQGAAPAGRREQLRGPGGVRSGQEGGQSLAGMGAD